MYKNQVNGSQSSCPVVLPVGPCDGHVIFKNGNMVVIEEGEIRIHSLSKDKGLSWNFTHASVFSSGKTARVISTRPLINVWEAKIFAQFFCGVSYASE